MVNKTFIIAEAGINHNGDIGHAKSLIEAAKESNADAIKFQTYITEKRTYAGSPIWDVLKKCELSYEQFRLLKEYADSVEIELFSTPFDSDALNFLINNIQVHRIKIASFDVTNVNFLQDVASYRDIQDYKVILSTGMSNSKEIADAIKCLESIDNLTVLHCKSSYPLNDVDANLKAISNIRQICNSFDRDSEIKVGYSDHTSGIMIPSLAVIAGATTIEKHFTLDLNNNSVDNAVSADPKLFKDMVKAIRLYEDILGTGELKLDACEEIAKKFRRK